MEIIVQVLKYYGDYEIIDEITKGSMSKIWIVKNSLNIKAILKEMNSRFSLYDIMAINDFQWYLHKQNINVPIVFTTTSGGGYVKFRHERLATNILRLQPQPSPLFLGTVPILNHFL